VWHFDVAQFVRGMTIILKVTIDAIGSNFRTLSVDALLYLQNTVMPIVDYGCVTRF